MMLLVQQWERWEEQLNRDFVSKDPPKRVKELIVAETLKRKVKKHMEDVENWQESCRLMRKARKKAINKDPLAEFPPLKLPKRPRFRLLLTSEELQIAHQTAEKKKSRWDRMAKPVQRKGGGDSKKL